MGKSSKKGAARKTEDKPTVIPGGAVVYVGRIPHGFYEAEMREYFGQFGEISRMRLSRNRTSGASKHYAFVEFKSAAVAQIVAESMNNYLLFNQLLQCHIVPNEQVHPQCFKGASRKFRVIPWRTISVKQHNAERSEDSLAKLRKRAAKRMKSLQERLTREGIGYDLSEIVH